MASNRDRVELDSCGIGFVAHTSGQPSREIVDLALTGLACMKHRQAIAADGLSGDGAGLLVPIPQEFFARVCAEATGRELSDRTVGVVSAFVRPDAAACAAMEKIVEETCAAEGITVLAWRDVPVDASHIGAQAIADLPMMRHCIIAGPTGADDSAAERHAYRARRAAEARVTDSGLDAYFVSWSFATITYKALVISDRLTDFYPDLAATDFVAPLAIFHSRFSTNTMPAWERAQPFRLLCHNGEINTIEGNVRRMVARGRLGTAEAGLGDEELFRPLFDPRDSDSGKLDCAIELLSRAGRDIRHAVAMSVPEAWEGLRDLAPGVRDFFRYHACLTDPWDGPAGLVFTDGRRVGASLDRNGLRPMRWQSCEDGLVVCSSEAGAVPLAGHGKIRRGRLGPGQMLCVDPDAGGLQNDVAVKRWLADRAPYGVWVADGLRPFGAGARLAQTPDRSRLVAEQVTHGLSKEEVAMVLKPMAVDAKEPTFSMGDDIPFAAVSSNPRPLFHFLKQRFAQVSNPPIDHLRERLVMSLRTCLGPRRPLLGEGPAAARLLELATFFLYPSALETLLDPDHSPFSAVRLDATFLIADGAAGLRVALDRLADEALVAVEAGAGIVIISDRDVGPERAAVASLLATGAVHHRLVRTRRRQDTSIVVDSGDARDTHSVAALLGYGADALCPRLALQTVAALADDDQLGEVHASDAQAAFQAAIQDGVLKIFSKMGISTVDGYRAAQIFEAIGLGGEVIDLCLTGTSSTVGGIGFDALGADAIARHAAGFDNDVDEVTLSEPGLMRFRKRGGEYHANNPDVFESLHALSGAGDAKASTTALDAVPEAPAEDQGKVMFLDVGDARAGVAVDVNVEDSSNGAATTADVGGGSGEGVTGGPAPAELRAAHLLQRAVREGRAELFAEFARIVESRPVVELHDLLELVPAAEPISIDEVEPASAIARRFSTGAMSHGSLSREAHETLALAMNLIGAKSNCGEGGEDPYRFATRGSSQDKNSRIKQIASGRFGVTPEYCMYADELNIKMAQGSKPGEGGQLPGHKVSAEIARLRHTQPGVGLISPPPHHDIYSIEDLAQLIYDLKQVNPLADVSVKLVAEAGVGTISAGVVKAQADVVQISGANGGTGASSLSSIKHAGMPWELGLAEAQATLVDNGLRDRVKLRVDGGFKTGRHVMIAALLGADQYSFGTAAMLAEGCIMVRACHRDTCPTGIATQRPNLRAKFSGTPEGVATYMLFVAEEVRALLASLGLASLDDAIGRCELLAQRRTGDERADTLDLSPLLNPPADPAAARRFVAGVPSQRPRSALDERLLTEAFPALWDGDNIELDYEITNSDRTIGASLGGAIGLEWGEGLPPGSVVAHYTGSAGQSFGAFCGERVTLDLVGEANDYLGKGMAGGRVVVRPPADDAGDPVLAGNTVLYGATGGQVYVAGQVGERFCVRNSGAIAVVEGAGDHACEYMTAGTVVILGPVGYNFGAGMTGGQAFVYDPDGHLGMRLNRQLVDAAIPDDAQRADLRFLVEVHRELTGSHRASAMLADWDATVRSFWRVAPLGEVARIGRGGAARVAQG